MSQVLKINPSTGSGFPPSGQMADWQFARSIDDPCCCPIVAQGEMVTTFGLAALHRAGCDEAWIAPRGVHQ